MQLAHLHVAVPSHANPPQPLSKAQRWLSPHSPKPGTPTSSGKQRLHCMSYLTVIYIYIHNMFCLHKHERAERVDQKEASERSRRQDFLFLG